MLTATIYSCVKCKSSLPRQSKKKNRFWRAPREHPRAAVVYINDIFKLTDSAEFMAYARDLSILLINPDEIVNFAKKCL